MTKKRKQTSVMLLWKPTQAALQTFASLLCVLCGSVWIFVLNKLNTTSLLPLQYSNLLYLIPFILISIGFAIINVNTCSTEERMTMLAVDPGVFCCGGKHTENHTRMCKEKCQRCKDKDQHVIGEAGYIQSKKMVSESDRMIYIKKES